jgi:endonuclease YncB( thermonuclease family)
MGPQADRLMRPPYRYLATLISAHDGDTFTLNVDLGFHTHAYINVRLLGWNCPELSQPGGPEARDLATSLLTNATQLIIETEKDAQTFARWLGRVFVDGQDLGALLEAHHLATKRP